MKLTALAVSTVLLLTACATAPKPVQVMQACPTIPALELSLPQDALEQGFLDRMQDFLQGRLPEPISYELRLPPASPTGLRLNAN